MTEDKIISELESEIKRAEYVDISDVDSVDVDLLRSSLELIKRQKEALDVAPVKHAKNLAPHFGETICGSCGVCLDEMMRIIREEDGDYGVYGYQPKYCANCGAKFDGGDKP